MESSPGIPSGHGRAAPGKWAAVRATAATPALNIPATAISPVASHGSRTANGTATVPNRVTGATKGEAATLAGSE